MRRIVALLFMCQSLFALAQNPALDHLKMIYDQGYYRLVYRKSARLLANPEYDFSKLPAYYRAISTLQCAQETRWEKRHAEEISLSKSTLMELRKSIKGREIIAAHIREISYLKRDMDAWISENKEVKSFHTQEWCEFVAAFFSDLPLIDIDQNNSTYVLSNRPELKTRIARIDEAKKQLGVPYVTAGIDPSGFDCSGFTSFVMNKEGKTIPRRAKDQFDSCVKLKEDAAQIGDFVFFSNGGEVNHVGILVNELGKPKAMIHASTTTGICIVEIEDSPYWRPRIVGYGTFAP